MKDLIILDMDGTLYAFKNGSLRASGLYDTIITNTEAYLVEKQGFSTSEAREAVASIIETYGTRISIGLEEQYHVDRYEYFNYAWDIPAEQYMNYDSGIHDVLSNMSKDRTIILLSDAPKIWIRNVLSVLGVSDLFDDTRIFSGESNVRKEHGNAFQVILAKYGISPERCVAFGDQEETDIIPAKKLGLKTVLVGTNKYTTADTSIETITEYKNALEALHAS